MRHSRVLRLGVIDAARFATCLAESVVSLPTVRLTAVAGIRLEAARRLATSYDACGHASWEQVRVAGTGPARVQTFDGTGRPVETSVSTARTVTVTVPAGGFALIRR